MKIKFILFCIALLFANICIEAKTDSNFTLYGDMSVINDHSITAQVVFDYSDMTIEGKPYMEYLKGRGDDFVRDWPGEIATAESQWFVSQWNNSNNKGMQISLSCGPSEYKMLVAVRRMDIGFYSPVGNMYAGGARMTATIYIFRGNDFDNSLFTIQIDDYQGYKGDTEAARMNNLYYYLARQIPKAIQKTKGNEISASMPSVELTSGLKQQIEAGTFVN